MGSARPHPLGRALGLHQRDVHDQPVQIGGTERLEAAGTRVLSAAGHARGYPQAGLSTMQGGNHSDSNAKSLRYVSARGFKKDASFV